MIVAEAALTERRKAVAPGAPLAPLFESLAAELEPWLVRPLYIPDAKALLSKRGGRCERDSATLEFDPASPREHRCPRCGQLYSGDLHHRAWVMPYQLWLAERALHGALFYLLRGDQRHGAFARRVLSEYAGRYAQYPNVDNVLGPSRLFFSTYLESVWLLQICLATRFLELAGDTSVCADVTAAIVRPARGMIAEFNEGRSNRQVWNNAALISAAILEDDAKAVQERATGPGGVHEHLATALLPDGSWYEGENYHQFALRGLWYDVALLEVAGVPLDDRLRERFERAFAVPILTALPDFTMPSRKDSQYAVSLRQWRIAELFELGLARRRDPSLVNGLARCYESGHAARDTGRARSAADIERNAVSTALTRADLGWRALLHALPELPRASGSRPRSVILRDQGYAVFRREDDTYVGFEFGQSGGGHGHPDRLNLTLYRKGGRVLDDMGTGSYVDASLHWFRSTLAHNAPLIDGRSQPLRDGALLAYDEREGLGWIVGAFDWPDAECHVERSIVVTPDYLVDEVRWSAPRAVRFELPWHLDPVVPPEAPPSRLEGGIGEEDGFDFLTEVHRVGEGSRTHRLESRGNGVSLHLFADDAVEVFASVGPGQPPSQRRTFALVRASGTSGSIRSVLTWSDAVVRFEGATVVVESSQERHVHRRTEGGWHVDLNAAGARSSIDLGGFTEAPDTTGATADRQVPHAPIRIHRQQATFGWLSAEMQNTQGLLRYELGQLHYRRTEQSWDAAGRPTAYIAISAAGSRLYIHGVVRAGERVFATRNAENHYDNEHPDTMAAGVQLHLKSGDAAAAWLFVPEEGVEAMRVRAVSPSRAHAPEGRWRVLPDGWEFRIEMPLMCDAGEIFALDLLINETTAGRERRRGQLVLSGGRGEFAYLRGDRQDDDRLVPMVVVP